MAKNLLQNSCDLVNTTPVPGTAGVITTESLVLIQKNIVTSSISTTFTNLSKYPYSNFRLITSNITLSSGGTIFLQLSTNNGALYISSGYVTGSQIAPYNSSSFTNPNGSIGFIPNNTQQVTGPTFFCNGFFDLYQMNTPGAFVCGYGIGINVSAAIGSEGGIFQGVYQTAINANAFQLTVNGGANMSGIFSLYGYS